MRVSVRTIANERGVALPLALFALVMLSGLLLAFLTMSGMEPEIAANLGDVARARYAADAGVEWAYDQLAQGNTNWNTLLGGTAVAGSNPPAAWLTAPSNTQITLPTLTAAFGTYTVTIRNDSAAGDSALTGLAACNGPGASDCAGATTDSNGAVIITATGSYRGITKQIQVVLRRVTLPPFQGAYSMPGVQSDLLFSNNNFVIDGRDYKCTATCTDPDFNKRTYGLNTDQKNMKYGIATSSTANPYTMVPPGGTQAPKNLSGIQENMPGYTTTYEQVAEQALDTGSKRSNVIGKDQTNLTQSTTGLNTVAQVPGVDPAVMSQFLTQLANFSGTTVLQSTIACPMVITGNSSGGPDTNQGKLNNGCGVNQTLDLGTRQNPKLIYFRGELDPSSSFTGLKTNGNLQGAGILIVEDGDFRPTANFRWDGIVIITGRYVSTIFDTGSKVTIYGATVSNETIWNEGGNSNQTTYYDGYFAGTAVDLYNSQENLDLVQRRLLFRMSTWREL